VALCSWNCPISDMIVGMTMATTATGSIVVFADDVGPPP